MSTVAASNEREILSGTRELRAFIGEIALLDWRQLFLESVQPAIVEIQDRIIGKNARDQQIARVGRRRWHNHTKSGYVSEPRLQRLRMLRALLAASIDDRAHRYWRAHLTSEHRTPFGSLCHQLINREQHEVDSRMNYVWPVATERCTQRSSCAAGLRHRSIDDTLATELAVEVGH